MPLYTHCHTSCDITNCRPPMTSSRLNTCFRHQSSWRHSLKCPLEDAVSSSPPLGTMVTCVIWNFLHLDSTTKKCSWLGSRFYKIVRCIYRLLYRCWVQTFTCCAVWCNEWRAGVNAGVTFSVLFSLGGQSRHLGCGCWQSWDGERRVGEGGGGGHRLRYQSYTRSLCLTISTCLKQIRNIK